MAIRGKNSGMTAIEPAPTRRLPWRLVTVRRIVIETPRVKSLLLNVDGWPGHRPGQHVDIRLTAKDGSQAQRSYSIASPPEDELLSLTIERVANGEVSPYLVDEVGIGDAFELRGPIGGHFVWTAAIGGPLCVIGGGSGIVPLMAMLRHRDRQKAGTRAVLLYSSRSREEVIYRDELDAMMQRDPRLRVIHTLTRAQPPGWTGYRRRIDAAMLSEACFPPAQNPRTFVCSSTSLVENVSQLLVELGYDPLAISTERFGPSGP